MPTVSARLIAEVSGYINPLKAATQATKDLRTELGQAAKEGKLDAVAGMALKAGLALSSGFLLATTAAARFEKQMSEVDAVAGATGSELDALSEAALKAGRDTVFSATEAAKAEAELAKAGLSAGEILGGALTGSLSLAAAGSLDLAEAADVAAKAMNVFNLEGKDVEHIADVLASAANKSATDVHELGAALRMGGLAAKNAGLTLEDTVGTLAAFADNALIGSDAGTSLKTMLQALAAPSKESRDRMKELGIAAFDAQGNFVGVAKLAGILQSQLKNLTQEQRNEALATIFGADAMRAATVLYGEGEAGIRKMIAAVNDEGAAAETAAKKTDNLMGDVERLTGALEGLFIEAGSGSNKGLRVLVQTLGKVVDIVASLPPPVLTAATVLTGLSGVGLLAFSAFIKTRRALHDMLDQMREAGPVMSKMARGLESVETGLANVTRVGIAAGLAFGAMKLVEQIGPLRELSEASADLAVEWGILTEEQSKMNSNFKIVFGQGGIIDIAANKLFGDDSGSLEIGLTRVAKAEAEMGKEAVSAATDLKKLTEAQRESIEKAFDLEEAQDRVKDSIVALREQLKQQREEHVKGAGSLDANTDAGRRNRESVRGLTRDYQDLIEKTAAEGKSTQGLRDQLEKTLVSMGFSRDEARKYASALGTIPDVVTTKVKLEDEQAKKDARETHSELYRLFNKPIYQQIIVTGPGQTGGFRWGGITEHAQSGLLREAAMFRPQSPARYAFAEPGTGGEAFVPKHGNYGRSMSILSHAAGWYRASVTPGGAGGGMVVNNYTLNVTAPVGSHPREIGGVLMGYLRAYENGGGDISSRKP